MELIGIWSEHAPRFALLLSLGTMLAFSLPIFFAPATWGRLLQWRIPTDTDLTWYFARCLGAFALVTNVLLLRAAWTGEGLQILLEFFALFCIMMLVVHLWGAIEGRQPWTETAEIGLWGLFLALTLLFMPG